MFFLVFTGAALGGVAVLAGLLQFSVITRRDPLHPDACGRRAGWARRTAGLHVRRAHHPADDAASHGPGPAKPSR